MIGRRLIAVVLVVALALAAVALATGGGGDRDYRFTAVFDTARGMVPGQLVKIAGTKVGTVERVALTADNKARLTLDIERRFAPLRDDARCRILPEGLVSEYYVECDPGTPGRSPLAARDGRDPELPLSRTAVSVTLQQVIDTFSLPVSQRVRVLVNELGLATSGRGEDLNALLRRANPALGQAQDALEVVRQQRTRIADATRDTDQVLARLDGRRDDLRAFVREAATLTRTTDARRGEIAATIRSLPPLLRQVDGSLRDLDTASTALTPTARALRRSMPVLRRANVVIPSFTEPGVRALRALRRPSTTGRRAIPVLQPVVNQLDELGRRLGPTAALGREFLVSLRDSGGIEHLNDFLYGFTQLVSAYDGISHQVNFTAKVQAKCLINEKEPGCDHRFNSPGRGRIPVNDPSSPPDLPGRPGRARATAPQRTPAPAAVGADDLPRATRQQLKTLLDGVLK
jgi:virulence factor Mce-like protein